MVALLLLLLFPKKTLRLADSQGQSIGLYLPVWVPSVWSAVGFDKVVDICGACDQSGILL